MPDPFILHDRDIRGDPLRDSPSSRWIEDIAPDRADALAYLKPALRSNRLRFAYIAFVALIVMLAARSGQLQIVKGDAYRAAAENNRIRIVYMPAPRGAIVDRNGITLTNNIPRFQLALNPLDIPANPVSRSEVLGRLSKSTGIPPDTLRIASEITRLPVSPIVLTTNLTLDDVYPLLINTQGIDGVTLEIASARQYIYPREFSHLLGYLGKISEQEKNEFLLRGYRIGDMVGKTGIEAYYENALRGVDGKRSVEVNAQGHAQTVVASKDPIPGNTLSLTIDAELQNKAYEILQTHLARARKTRAAIIVLNPQNGETLALVSTPGYDANSFTSGPNRAQIYKALLDNPDNPLFARAISGAYPSGSVIKPAIAAAALQEGVITPRTTILSVGGLRIGQWFFPDWKAGGHGSTNVIKAIAESVNTFFYTIGGGYGTFSGLGIERLAHYLERFGFGAPVGIDLFGGAKGLVPRPAWKAARSPDPWYIGDTYHFAIGQGDFLVTPIQIARMTAYFASGGKWTRPHVVLSACHPEPREGSRDSEGRDSSACGLRMTDAAGPGIDHEHIQTVREGMRATVLAGSARSLQTLPITMAGKTGTAQWSSTKSPHAWFTGFAPYENPEIVVTILVEEGGEGSSIAVPIAKEIVAWWFEHIHK